MKLVGSRKVYSVRGVVLGLWRRLDGLPSIWTEGEVTNLSRGGAQVYFSLVDVDHTAPTQIDATMQANVFDRLNPPPADGTLVHAYGRVEFWSRRSQIRMRVERLEQAGEGLLLARIAELRRRLDAEGLTADGRKRPIPFLPRRVGLVTAREGAARVDFLTHVTRRAPGVQVLVVGSRVQGDGAPAELVRAIAYLDAQPDVDVIVLARGGGALEDLMAFNSEVVCRAVAASTTPVVSAVGHETDTTLCDLVADLRVSTPTKAAEAVVPHVADLNARLAQGERRAATALARLAQHATDDVTDRARRLVNGLHGRGNLAAQRVDALSGRLSPALARSHRAAAETVERRARTLARAMVDRELSSRRRVERADELLQLLSPERTVARGYAIVRDEQGAVVGRVADTGPGRRLAVQLRDGVADVRVEHTEVSAS